MDLKYPIGTFQYDGDWNVELIEQWTLDIANAPTQLRHALESLTEEELNTPYRPGGWSVRQVVHHMVDSHMNAYIRFKLALTEENPTIKPYDEAKWAEQADYSMPIDISLTMLESLHKRWVFLLRALSDAELNRTFIHPKMGQVSLWKSAGIYSWHGRHHIAHITSMRKRLGI